MKYFALAGNPNSGKTTLFNSLTGSTAHVGNWPGVTVDRRDGVYKKSKEPISIVDLPGIYSLSPYTSEEVISRNYLLEEKPDCIINIVDATNLERNLYLTTQLLEMDVPVVVALNMMDAVRKNGDSINIKKLEELLEVPVVEISALREENLDLLMNRAIEFSSKKRKAYTVLHDSDISSLIYDLNNYYIMKGSSNSLFHAIKLVENDEIEVNSNKDLLEIVEKFKTNYKNSLFENDYEALIADARYKYITKHIDKIKVSKKNSETKLVETPSDKADKVLTNKWAAIPIFLLILFVIFHFTFSEDLFGINLFTNCFSNVAPSFEGTIFEGLIWTNGGINSPGVIFFNFVDSLTGAISDSVRSLMEGAQPWASGLVVDGMLGGLFSVISFLPQILVLFLFFSILEDSGYMARIAFILDKLLRKFGLSGRAFLPMIMGFGCSVPAMINTRTLADEKERTCTIRVIPFFSCGAKLPILTAIAGGITQAFGFGNVDLITFSMYVIGMVSALCAVILMRNTSMKGDTPPFIMELPAYHMPQFKSLMIHLWDKAKHFVKKAFTIILASTILIWFLTNFGWDWKYVGEGAIDQSILASLGKLIQPLFTPLGFGSQIGTWGWIFAVAAITGLIAKENVIATFFTLALCVVGLANIDPDIAAALTVAQEASEDGALEVMAIIEATGITWPALISFVVFNMTTIPCFAAVATAKAELPKKEFKTTVIFWLVASYFISTLVYMVLKPFQAIGSGSIGQYCWTWVIALAMCAVLLAYVFLYNKLPLLRKKAK